MVRGRDRGTRENYCNVFCDCCENYNDGDDGGDKDEKDVADVTILIT